MGMLQGRRQHLNDGAAQQRGLSQVEGTASVLLYSLWQPGGCKTRAGCRLRCLLRRQLDIAGMQVACAGRYHMCPHAMLPQSESCAQGIVPHHQCIKRRLQV